MQVCLSLMTLSITMVVLCSLNVFLHSVVWQGGKLKLLKYFVRQAMASESQMVSGVLSGRMHPVLSVESEKSLGMQKSFLISLTKILL